MKKSILGVIVALSICVIALVGCSQVVPSAEALKKTQEVWDAANEKTATDTIKVEGLLIPGLLTVKNMDLVIERNFTVVDDAKFVNIKAKVSGVSIDLSDKLNKMLSKLDIGGIAIGDMVTSILTNLEKVSIEMDAKFNLDTYAATEFTAKSTDLNKLGLGLADSNIMKDGELNVTGLTGNIDKEDPLVVSAIYFAKGHMSTLFAPAAGVNAGEENVKGVQVVEHIVPILKSAILRIPSSIDGKPFDFNKILTDVFGSSDVESILTEQLEVTNPLYSSYVKGGIITDQTFTSGINIAISKSELTKIYNSIKPLIPSNFVGYVGTVIGMIDITENIIQIEKFTIASTYKI